jgi:hypothetical protein
MQTRAVEDRLIKQAAWLWLVASGCGFSPSQEEVNVDALQAAAVELPQGTIETTGISNAAAVDLRSAGTYAILAQAGISGISAAVTGDLGVSPAAATYVTGFSLVADSTNAFSTSAQVVGKVYAASYAGSTPASLTTAIGDMQLACADAAARPPDVTELAAGEIGGMTLGPGIYKWSSGVSITQDLTLTGSANDVWIFEIAQDLTLSGAVKIVLSGGALTKNVFWQVSGGPVSLAALAHLEGVVLTQTSITLAAGASITGRLFAQTAVDIDGSTVTQP